MPDSTNEGVFNTDMFPDAEQRTINFFAKCNIRSLRKVLEFARKVPELEVDATSVWDDAKRHFPEEFSKGGSPSGPVSREMLKLRMAERAARDSGVPMEDAPKAIQGVGLHCQFCGKSVNSSSGKTLHEKVCKERPIIDAESGELLNP